MGWKTAGKVARVIARVAVPMFAPLEDELTPIIKEQLKKKPVEDSDYKGPDRRLLVVREAIIAALNAVEISADEVTVGEIDAAIEVLFQQWREENHGLKGIFKGLGPPRMPDYHPMMENVLDRLTQVERSVAAIEAFVDHTRSAKDTPKIS